MGIERDVERMLRGESAEPSFLNDLSQKTYLINADYEQKYISSLEQRVELLNAQISLLEAKGLMRKH
mgnify:CR=1 FL=1